MSQKLRAIQAPSRFPCSQDPQWRVWSRPLYHFLHEPRTWPMLIVWAKSEGTHLDTLRNYLAWLEDNRQATSYRDDSGAIRWTAITVPEGHRLGRA